MSRLILASGSRYRRALLARLGLPFDVVTPGIDESERDDESPAALALRLARAKAEAVSADTAIVIGADQVPELAGRILRKPEHHDAALAQLIACQGKTVNFHTAISVRCTTTARQWQHIDLTCVRFAQRERVDLARYLERERALDCAGGFKVEGLGITLFESIESADPTGLIGLPLIRLTHILREAGLDPLGTPTGAD